MTGARLFIGVDPGINGAMAGVDALTRRVHVIDVPTHEVRTTTRKTRRELDVPSFLSALGAMLAIADGEAHAVVERVSAHPGQGVTSTFRFGYAAGVAHALLAASLVPITFVSPLEWQRAVRVGKGQDAARQRASQLFPRDAALFARVKDQHRADAALMAWFGAHTQGGRLPIQ